MINDKSGQDTPTVNAMADDSVAVNQKQDFNHYLVAIGRDQDEQAFIAIYDHFAGRVRSFLMGKGLPENVAEELMQEVMLTLWRRAQSYDPQKAAASTWIFTIARNRRIDYLRGNSRIEVELDDALLEHADFESNDTMEKQAILHQDSKRLHDAMEALPADQRQVMHLSYFRGQSHGDIAQWLNLPVGTVKSRIRLAMQSLRNGMQTKDPTATKQLSN